MKNKNDQSDIETILLDQDVPASKIADAKRAAENMSSVLREISFAPVDAVAPDAYRELLRGCARKTRKP